MRFGAHYLPTYVPHLDGSPPAFYRRMFEQMELLDEVGVDDLWVTEHHFHRYGGLLPHPPTFLAAIARTTKRIHLGVAISTLPLHDPLETAEAYAMVDVVSDGRLEFGVGRGSTPPEFEGFGRTQKDSGPRMREAAEIIRLAWSQDKCEFHGELFDVQPIRVLPKPVQRPHPPIWVGASRSDDTFRWAGHMGFHLMTLPFLYEPEMLRGLIDLYRRSLVEAGHDPATREVLGKFHLYVGETDAAARSEAPPFLAEYERLARARQLKNADTLARHRGDIDKEISTGNVIAGDASRCIELIHEWRERLGLTTISGTVFFGGLPQELTLASIRRLAEKVIPAFPRTAPAGG